MQNFFIQLIFYFYTIYKIYLFFICFLIYISNSNYGYKFYPAGNFFILTILTIILFHFRLIFDQILLIYMYYLLILFCYN